MQPSVNMNSLRFHAQPTWISVPPLCFLAKFLSHLSVFCVAWRAQAETQKALRYCSRCPQNEEKVTGEEKRVELMVLWGVWGGNWDLLLYVRCLKCEMGLGNVGHDRCRGRQMSNKILLFTLWQRELEVDRVLWEDTHIFSGRCVCVCVPGAIAR